MSRIRSGAVCFSFVAILVLAASALPLGAFQGPRGGGGGGGTPPPPSGQNQSGRTQVGATIMASRLVKKVAPVVPPQARGVVVLNVAVGTDGKVIDVSLASGSATWTEAAMAAVRQWEYQPMRLNGQLVEVDTTVSITLEAS